MSNSKILILNLKFKKKKVFKGLKPTGNYMFHLLQR